MFVSDRQRRTEMEGNMNVLLKVIMRLALSATLYSHDTMSLMGMYEPKKPKLKKDGSR